MIATAVSITPTLSCAAASNGKWQLPGDLDDYADNCGLIRVARNEVLDKLQARITEAHETLDRIEDEARQASGITWRP